MTSAVDYLVIEYGAYRYEYDIRPIRLSWFFCSFNLQFKVFEHALSDFFSFAVTHAVSWEDWWTYDGISGKLLFTNKNILWLNK